MFKHPIVMHLHAQSCLTLCDPMDYSQKALLSMGFSRQEYLKVKVTQLFPTLCDPMDCIVHGILYVRILEWVSFPFSRGFSQPRDWSQVFHIAGIFFTSWATRNTWMHCNSFIQEIFLTQGSNPPLLHCRQILCLLSHWGFQNIPESVIFLITSYQMVFSVLSKFFLHKTYYYLAYYICLLVCVCVPHTRI